MTGDRRQATGDRRQATCDINRIVYSIVTIQYSHMCIVSGCYLTHYIITGAKALSDGVIKGLVVRYYQVQDVIESIVLTHETIIG